MNISAISSWALLIWSTLEKEGFDPSVTFKRAGADIKKLSNPEERFEIATMQKLWAEALHQTQNPDIGFAIGEQWNATTFHALGMAWLASDTLREAFGRLSRYSAIVNSGLISDVLHQGTLIGLQLDSKAPTPNIHGIGIDAGVAALVKMSRLLLGEQFLPVQLDLPSRLQERNIQLSDKIATLFAEPINYQAEHCVLWVDSRAAQKSLLTANAKLAIVNEQAASDYLDRLLKGDIENTITNLIANQLPSGEVNENWVAEQLHMSVRTLRRKLQESNTTFRDLLNQVRQQIAAKYIRDTQVSCIEIAYLLGFSDQANFTRAFKRWFECSPTDYRQQLKDQKAAQLGDTG